MNKEIFVTPTNCKLPKTPESDYFLAVINNFISKNGGTEILLPALEEELEIWVYYNFKGKMPFKIRKTCALVLRSNRVVKAYNTQAWTTTQVKNLKFWWGVKTIDELSEILYKSPFVIKAKAKELFTDEKFKKRKR